MLQKGVVDGSSHPLESNKGWKLGEVVHFLTKNYSTAYTQTFVVLMNKEKWNNISPTLQKVIKEINSEWAVKHGKAWDDSDKAGLEFFLSNGGKVIELSPEESIKWQEAVSPVIDDYINKSKANGIDGKSVVDFIKSKL
jgi:TRAP-type C4-dicarboxylate transport system substrate-binding protein